MATRALTRLTSRCSRRPAVCPPPLPHAHSASRSKGARRVASTHTADPSTRRYARFIHFAFETAPTDRSFLPTQAIHHHCCPPSSFHALRHNHGVRNPHPYQARLHRRRHHGYVKDPTEWEGGHHPSRPIQGNQNPVLFCQIVIP